MKLEELLESQNKPAEDIVATPEKNTKSKSNVEILMHICDTYKYFTDESGTQFAEIIDPYGKKMIVEIKNDDFMDNLRFEFFERTKKMPSKTDLVSTINTIAFRTKRLKHIEPVFLRYAQKNNKHYIDLNNDDNEVIEITRNHWIITNSPGVKFKTTSQQKSICRPEKSNAEDLKLLLKYMRLKNEKQKMLVLATVCSFIISDMIRPIICFVGPKGSGKTTNATNIRSLIDPRELLFNNTIKYEKDLSLIFSQNAVPLIDNVSNMSRNLSDIFCKTVTGTGFEARTLYTNTDLTNLSFRRGIIMTALEIPNTMPDFLSRCIHIELDEMGEGECRSEKEMLEEFEEDKPKIFGGLLQTVANAKSHVEWMEFHKLPRLADYAKFGAAVCNVLGYDPNEFMKALFLNLEYEKQNISHSNDPFVDLVVELMKNTEEHKGSTTDLLASLKKISPNKSLNISVEGLGRKLRYVAEYLKLKGIDIKFKRISLGTEISISKFDLSKHLKQKYDEKYVTLNYDKDRAPSKIDYSSESIFE